MKDKQNKYVDNLACMQNLVHEELIAMAKAKHNYLVQRKKWGQKSMEEEKMMALEVAGLKEELRLTKNMTDKVEMATRKITEVQEDQERQSKKG